jgi:hypothetical protein
MKRFILFLMLIAAISIGTESKACIVLPNNSLNVSGPTTVCDSDPPTSYTLSYSTGVDDPYVLYLAVQFGEVTNIQPFSSLGGVINGEGCVPTLVQSVMNECFLDQVYNIPPACRGGITFDVEWSTECSEGDLGGQISANMTSTAGDLEDIHGVAIDDCLGNPDDKDIYINNSVSGGNSMDVKIFPNPASEYSTTISLPSDYDDYEVRITDINGKLVNQFFEAKDRIILNTGELTGGVYFVQVIAFDGTVNTQKLLISK